MGPIFVIASSRTLKESGSNFLGALTDLIVLKLFHRGFGEAVFMGVVLGTVFYFVVKYIADRK